MSTESKRSGWGGVHAFQKQLGGEGSDRCWGGGITSLLKDFFLWGRVAGQLF